MKLVPSVKMMYESSLPSRPSSSSTRLPASPNSSRFVNRSINFFASLADEVTSTPLPVQSPSAFTTTGHATESRFAPRIKRSIHARGRNSIPRHEFFRENFAALELCRVFRRAQNRQAPPLEFIRDALNQRQFRPYDRQVRNQFHRQIRGRCYVANIQRDAIGVARNSAVTRRAPDFLYARALPQFPRNRVLASAAADDQDFHSVCRNKNDTAAPPAVSTPAADYSQFGLLPLPQKCFHLRSCIGTSPSFCFFLASPYRFSGADASAS